MNDFIEISLLMIIVILILGVLLFTILGCVYLYTVNIGEANIISIYVDDKLVYEGKKAFVNISSGGMTTTITIYRQLFPFNITDKTTSSNNVIVK